MKHWMCHATTLQANGKLHSGNLIGLYYKTKLLQQPRTMMFGKNVSTCAASEAH